MEVRDEHPHYAWIARVKDGYARSLRRGSGRSRGSRASYDDHEAHAAFGETWERFCGAGISLSPGRAGAPKWTTCTFFAAGITAENRMMVS